MSETNDQDDLEDLFRAERERDELPVDRIDDAWRSLDARIRALPKIAPPAPTAPSRSSAVVKTIVVAAVFGAGVLTGTWLERKPPEASTTTTQAPSSAAPLLAAPSVEPPSSAVVSPPMVAISSLPSSPIAPPHIQPSTSAAAVPSAAPVASGPTDLGDERSLVEGARVALLRGRPTDALALAESHEKRFPGGELAEDRDFVRVRALRDAGRRDEARTRARAFLVRYPKSGLRGAVAPIAE